MDKIKVGIAGCLGRMGQQIIKSSKLLITGVKLYFLRHVIFNGYPQFKI